jgi:hypothetical protein
MTRRIGSLTALLLFLTGGPAAADEPDHLLALQAGGQIGINEYRGFFKLGAAYGYRLRGSTWLDLGAGVAPAAEPDLMFDVGLRWRLGQPVPRLRPYLRTCFESGHLFRGDYRATVGVRVGGGLAYYSLSERVGASAELSTVLGPAFGGPEGGVRFAAAVDILAGVEIQL